MQITWEPGPIPRKTLAHYKVNYLWIHDDVREGERMGPKIFRGSTDREVYDRSVRIVLRFVLPGVRDGVFGYTVIESPRSGD